MWCRKIKPWTSIIQIHFFFPVFEQVLGAWSLTMEPPCTQVPWTSPGRMSCAVTHLQPTSLQREATRTQRQIAPIQASHTIPAAASGARQLNHNVMSSPLVRVLSPPLSKTNKEMMHLRLVELLLLWSIRPCWKSQRTTSVCCHVLESNMNTLISSSADPAEISIKHYAVRIQFSESSLRQTLKTFWS